MSCEKLDHSIPGQGHSEGSECHLMFVQTLSSESSNSLSPNLIWCCIIMSFSIMQKVWCAIFKVSVTYSESAYDQNMTVSTHHHHHHQSLNRKGR